MKRAWFSAQGPEFQSWTEATSKDHPFNPQALAPTAQNSTVAPYHCPLVLPRDPEPASVFRESHTRYLCCCHLIAKMI